jgi:uncharacterized membrane protein/gas vesicle protein
MKQESASKSESNQAFRKLVSGAALGAVAMYLTDPDKGKRRRAVARDKMQSLMARTGDALDVTSRDLSNRMQGLRVQASRVLFQRNTVADDGLVVERVRARLGRAVSHPHAVKVSAHQGRVTLSGPVLAHEKEQLLEAVRSVPGVVDVEDNLEVHERADIPSLQGQGKRRQMMPVFLQENWPPALRAAAVLGGGMLGYYGLKRRSVASPLLTAVGLTLVARGLANMPLKRMVGADTEKLPISLEKSLYIAAPPETVFNIWSNYENFPHFMSHVQKVQDLGNGRSHWVVNGPAGTVIEWDADITELQRPNVIAWRTEPNSPVQHMGKVRFEPANGGTRVHVQMSYSPPAGVLGHAIASLFNGDAKKQMDEDLLRMKSFIESGIPPHDAAKPIRQSGAVLH